MMFKGWHYQYAPSAFKRLTWELTPNTDVMLLPVLHPDVKWFPWLSINGWRPCNENERFAYEQSQVWLKNEIWGGRGLKRKSFHGLSLPSKIENYWLHYATKWGFQFDLCIHDYLFVFSFISWRNLKPRWNVRGFYYLDHENLKVFFEMDQKEIIW